MTFHHSKPQLTSLLLSIFIVLTSNWVIAQPSSPAEAAEEARQQTGGKVLKVKTDENNRYRVKVLMPAGQVKTITIKKKSEK